MKARSPKLIFHFNVVFKTENARFHFTEKNRPKFSQKIAQIVTKLFAMLRTFVGSL